jgi:hypothetical protein
MSWHDYFHDDVERLRERIADSRMSQGKDVDTARAIPNPERGKEAPLGFHTDSRHI